MGVPAAIGSEKAAADSEDLQLPGCSRARLSRKAPHVSVPVLPARGVQLDSWRDEQWLGRQAAGNRKGQDSVGSRV